MDQPKDMRPFVEIPLLFPVEWTDEVFDKLTVRRPKFKDTRKAKGKTEEEETNLIISHLTGMPSPFVDELDVADIKRIGEIIKGFTESSQSTGDSGSELSPDI